MVQEHNQPAAHVWSQGGRDYDFISFGVSDALAHATQLLWPQPGEDVLDVATGTGWSARNAASMGAKVTAVDIADQLLEAAKELASHIEPAIRFENADAEALPFDDASFDGVISTFGVMFSADQAQAAAELARVCRPGGRVVLATWDPDPEGYVSRFFALTGKYNDAPPPARSPMEWGSPRRLDELLGAHFDLACYEGVSIFIAPDSDAVWGKYAAGFGPVRALAESLDEERLADFRREFIEFHDSYREGDILRCNRKCLLVRGVRR